MLPIFPSSEMIKHVKNVFPKFKVEQIAIATDQPQAIIQMLGSTLGLDKWSTDIVKSEALLFGVECENTAQLNFNYDLGFELEVLTYTDGQSWHDTRLLQGQTYPFLSHIGCHCSEEDAQEMINQMAGHGIYIAQEVWTKSHTNEAIAGKRKYHYVVFDSRDAVGFDLKLIVRIDL